MSRSFLFFLRFPDECIQSVRVQWCKCQGAIQRVTINRYTKYLTKQFTVTCAGLVAYLPLPSTQISWFASLCAILDLYVWHVTYEHGMR